MISLDVASVAFVVVGSVAFLGFRFRSPKPPACHQTRPHGAGSDEGSVVVVGASLQRGLQRARARASEKRVNA
jgi:hypothetical protein